MTATAPSRIAFWLGHWPIGVLCSLLMALTPQPKPRWEEASLGLRKIQHAYLTGNAGAASRGSKWAERYTVTGWIFSWRRRHVVVWNRWDLAALT
jgi:hypothetical protein